MKKLRQKSIKQKQTVYNMKKIYFYLILVYSINFYANDTITAVSIKNINLREQATTDSKILTEIKTDDTLKILSNENDWSKVIYKDSINGYVKSEFTKEIKNDVSPLKNMKQFFFESLFLLSILIFGFHYLLKSKTNFFKKTNITTLIFRSINIGSIFTTMIFIYVHYHNLSFFQILAAIVLLLVFLFTLFMNYLFGYTSEKHFLEDVNTKNTSIDDYITEIHSNLKELNRKYNQNEDEILDILIEEFGRENSNNLITNLVPIIGMPYEIVIHYFGEPEKINESSDSNNIRQIFFYDKINNRGNDGTWRLKFYMLNNVLEKYEMK